GRHDHHPRAEGRVRPQDEVMTRACVALALVAATAVLDGQTRAADWPQWRGPNRDGSIVRITAPKTWPDPLTGKWQIDVCVGYATPMLVGSRLYVFSRRGDNEVLAAIDAEGGKALWTTSYPAAFTINPAAARHEKGPKSTPTFASNTIYTLGMAGVVTAF